MYSHLNDGEHQTNMSQQSENNTKSYSSMQNNQNLYFQINYITRIQHQDHN
jgi:hypothetical protein